MKRKIEELEKNEKCAYYGLLVDFCIIDESGKIKTYIHIRSCNEDKARKELQKYFEIYEKALEENRVISFERIFMFRI